MKTGSIINQESLWAGEPHIMHFTKIQRLRRKISDMFVFKNRQLELKVIFDGETAWQNQSEIARLFGKDKTVITPHINNILTEKKEYEKSNMQKMHFANSDKPVKFYSLDIVLAVWYRTSSAKASSLNKEQRKIKIQPLPDLYCTYHKNMSKIEQKQCT